MKTWSKNAQFFFSVFYDHTWVPGSMFKLYTSFSGVPCLGGQKLVSFHVLQISEHRNTWKSGPKKSKFFESVLWPYISAWSNSQDVCFIFRGGGVGGVQNCCNNTLFYDFWAQEYMKKWSKNAQSFLVCFMTVSGCLAQFSSRMLRFSGRRGLEESRTAVITRFLRSLSTGIHVIVMERWQHWKTGTL